MFFKFGQKESDHSQDDHVVTDSDKKWVEVLSDKEVLEYFAPYADLSDIDAGLSPVPSQTDLFANGESLKE